MREAALVGMVDGVLDELKSYPKSTGVVKVRRYVERALFPFAMTQVMHSSALQQTMRCWKAKSRNSGTRKSALHTIHHPVQSLLLIIL